MKVDPQAFAESKPCRPAIKRGALFVAEVKDCFSLNQGWAATAQWQSHRSANILSTTDAEKVTCVLCVCVCVFCVYRFVTSTDCCFFLFRKWFGQMFTLSFILEHNCNAHSWNYFCGSWCLKSGRDAWHRVYKQSVTFVAFVWQGLGVMKVEINR